MNDDARSTLIKPSTIRFERLLPGPLERVWAYLTESKKRATWLAGGEFDLRVGGRIELIFDNDSLSDDAPKGGGMIAGVGAGWPVHTGILADRLNGVKPRPFWATHDRLMKETSA